MTRNLIAALSLAVALASSTHAANTLEATVDHDVLEPGETVELRLRLVGDEPAVAPDLAPLTTAFDVLDTSQSRRISITNGVREASTDWLVTLAPRTAGALVIPALSAGGATSAPIALQVADAQTTPADGQQPALFVESSVDQTAPFVQGEVRYTVKVFDAAGMREGALTEPSADRLGVRSLGEGRAYDEMVGGRRYRVHEREYALVPQASGEIVVPPVTLQATLPDTAARGGRRSAFGGSSLMERFFGDDPFFDSVFDRGRPVTVRSNAVTLSVQARPDAAGEGWFLPAKQVELSREWGTTPPTFRVGEPVDHTIVVQALGASAEQIPALDVPAADGVKQYADAPETRTVPTGGGTLAERRQRYSLIPTTPGPLTLPAVEVRWWDVDAKQARTATLEAETIEVLPSAGTATDARDTAAAAHAAPTRDSSNASAAKPSEPSTTASPTTPTLWWLFAATLLGVALAVIAWAVARRTRRSPAGAARPAARDLTAAIESACRANDARATRTALLAWAAQQWSDAPATLSEIARRLGAPALGDALAGLDRTLYAREPLAWDGAGLWLELHVAMRSLRSGHATTTADPLPSLYPRDRAA